MSARDFNGRLVTHERGCQNLRQHLPRPQKMIRSFPLIHREEANLIAKTVTMMEEEEREGLAGPRQAASRKPKRRPDVIADIVAPDSVVRVINLVIPASGFYPCCLADMASLPRVSCMSTRLCFASFAVSLCNALDVRCISFFHGLV